MSGRATPFASLDRRTFLKAGGALVVGFSLGVAPKPGRAQAAARGATAGPPDPERIDTWLAIHADNTATLYIGYVELGQGTTTALPQIAAEELDLALAQITTAQHDTNVTPNQGGTYSSASIARGGPQVRRAAAEARQALLVLASERLGAPVERLRVENGVVTAADGGGKVTYGELVGDELFEVPFTGSAPVKSPADYKLVGARPARKDLPAKVAGTYTYIQQLRLPGMLHGRVVRPRGQRAYGAGARVVAVDEASIAGIAGARVLRRGDFLGVVAQNEWDAVRAARELDVTWDDTPSLPAFENLHQTMRADETDDTVVLERGAAGDAFDAAAHQVSFATRCPYQAHATFAPNCALADVTSDSALVICSSQDAYGARRTLAPLLGLPEDEIRVQYCESSGTYGHSCYDDVAQAAAILSQLAGAPVRVQFMRADEHGWDPYGPAHVGEVRAAADETGRIVAYEYHGWHHNWSLIEPSQQLATGSDPEPWAFLVSQQVSPQNCGAMYTIDNLRLVNHRLTTAKYLRAGWLRSPLDLSLSFTSEQAIDDLAYRLGADPYEFRKQNIADERWLGVLDAAAAAAGWTPRAARGAQNRGTVVSGRGIGLGTHLASWGGAVAEIDVNTETGQVVIGHLYGAIDAGLVVNPAIVEAQITGQLVQTASRMLFEEVTFDENGVTSLDWNSYRVIRFEECPDVTPVVVQRLDQPYSGAGEEVMAAAAAAIANAFFDATGVRMREYPFTADRVLAALGAA
ncbi:MAG: xanthine dehydrogenase family protein molybdopterin-binding subunit [Gammaproteobacteria bacterium]|nr:xanthine dehydrogenase family protein molybdopterin-binding subunit [Gammaproteobacteria bacterium]